MGSSSVPEELYDHGSAAAWYFAGYGLMRWSLGYPLGALTIHPDGTGWWEPPARDPAPMADVPVPTIRPLDHLYMDLAPLVAQYGVVFLTREAMARWPLSVLTPLLEQLTPAFCLRYLGEIVAPEVVPEEALERLWTLVQAVMRWFEEENRSSQMDFLAETILMELVWQPEESVTFSEETVTNWLRSITGRDAMC